MYILCYQVSHQANAKGTMVLYEFGAPKTKFGQIKTFLSLANFIYFFPKKLVSATGAKNPSENAITVFDFAVPP